MKIKGIFFAVLIAIFISATLLTVPENVNAAGTQPKVTGVTFNYINNVCLSFGYSLIYMVQFDQTVYVDMNGGTPYIEIGLDGGKKVKALLQTAGLYGNKEYISDCLQFVYNPSEGDCDSNGIDKGNSIVLNGGRIDNLERNLSINTTLYNIENYTYYVDAIKPYVESITLPANKTYKAGDVLEFTVRFSEMIGAKGTSYIALTLDGNRTVNANCTYGTDATYIRHYNTYTYTIQAGDADVDGILLGSSVQGGVLKGDPGSSFSFTKELNRDLSAAMSGKDTSGIRIDTQIPSATAFGLPAAEIYKAGRGLNFTVDFSEPVYVTTNSGIPYIEVQLDNEITKKAEYSGGSGSTRLVFTYNVEAGDVDSDGIIAGSSIILNGGRITDIAGNAAPLETFFTGGTSGILVDGNSMIQPAEVPEAGMYIIGETLNFSMQFDQVVTVDESIGKPYIELIMQGPATARAYYTSGSGTDKLVFGYTVLSGVGDSRGIAITGQIRLDGGKIEYLSGGMPSLLINPLPDLSGINIEGNPPRVVSVTVPQAGSYSSGQLLQFTVNFDKEVNLNAGDTLPYIKLLVGGLERKAEYTGGTGTAGLTFSYTAQDDDLALSGIGMGIDINLAGGSVSSSNGNAANVTLNNIGNLSLVKVVGKIPEVISVTAGEDRIYKEYDTISITVSFDERVNVNLIYSFFRPYVELITDSGSKVRAEYNSGSGTENLVFTYQIERSSSINDANGIDIGSNIILDTYYCSIKDSDGNNANLLLIGLPDLSGILIDTVSPAAVSVAVPASGFYKAGSALDFIINFNERVFIDPSEQMPYLYFRSIDRPGYIKADYVDGIGTESLRFRYTVKDGDAVTGILYFDFPGEYKLKDLAGHSVSYMSTYSKVPDLRGIILDTKKPDIVSVSSPANGLYPNSAELIFKVKFDEKVFVTESDELPKIELYTEAEENAGVTYKSGSGTQELLFSYTVKTGTIDIDGISLGSTILNAESISDSAGNLTQETLKNVASSAGVLLDGISPVILSIEADETKVYKENDTLEITVIFDDDISVDTVSGVPQLLFSMADGSVATAVYSEGSGSDALIFVYTIQNGDNSEGIIIENNGLNLSGGIIRDDSGNNAVPAISNSPILLPVRIDTAGPVIVDARFGTASRFIDITFNEGIYGAEDGASAITLDKLGFEFLSNEGSLKVVKLAGIKRNNSNYIDSSADLIGGENVIRVFLELEGWSSGVETIKISLLPEARIYDIAGNPSLADLSTGKINFVRIDSASWQDGTQIGLFSSVVSFGNGQLVNTITLNDSRLSDMLATSSGSDTSVRINADNNADIVDVRLNGHMINQLSSNNVELEVLIGNINYTIPASCFSVEQLISQSGENISPYDITLSIAISDISNLSKKIFRKVAENNNYDIVAEPVEFVVTCSYGNERTPISRYSRYIDCFIVVPDGIDLSKPVTGVIFNEDGTITHIPTEIVEMNGEYYARIRSMANGVYAVISNRAKFQDMRGHWAEEIVNDMYSRLVVYGVSNNEFSPEKNVTRAEFIAILTRGLGLAHAKADTNVFRDIVIDKWYYNAIGIAADLEIITPGQSSEFRPNDFITREEAFIAVYRTMIAAGYGGDLSIREVARLTAGFDDGKDYSQNIAVAACIKEGIILGNNGRIAGGESLTRAEAAAIISRMLSIMCKRT